MLVAGGDLSFVGERFENRLGSVSAGGSIRIDADQFFNIGAGGGRERDATYYIYTSSDAAYWNFINNLHQYNAYNDPNSPSYDPDAMSFEAIQLGWQTGGGWTDTSGDALVNAVVQAGGAVEINASQTLENAVIRPDGSGGAHLNRQLPPDLAQRLVDPLALPGYGLPAGSGLFRLNNDPGHRYLIESNPAFASLGGFLSSDYMLDLLGYSTDSVQRRLGDGLYEQRLIREAIIARTGKRFLVDALVTDEAQFRYLMENAVASKEALNLSVGISLSAEQVAALTHDIVWMEEREVAGERVLVPVLYLAQANDRLAPSGALIQGRDVALISGSDLNNSGTLRASRNLDMTALGSINNSGLAQADARLSLLAGDSIRNTQGGILKGRDVSLVAVEGDVINERSITVHQSRSHNVERVQSFVGDASRIEADGDLRVSAGRDLLNIGGALSATGNADLQAGRDLIIASAEAEQRQDISWRKGHAKDQSITQYGSEVQIGGDLSASAGGDLAIVASTVRAGGDIGLYADGDITIASAANSTTSDYRHKGGDKKVERQESQVRQQSAVIEAGGNLEVLAGGDLTLMASKLSAGNEAYFYASQNLNVLAAENSDYFLYDMSKKGGWGSKETRRDEVTRIRNVGTTITTGGDLSLESGGDQRYQRARLESGGDIVIDSDGRVVFEAVKDLDQESHEKSKNGALWTSMEGEGWTDETVLQSQLIAKGELMIRAAEGLQIDLKEIDQHTVSQTIDAMVQADPDLAWLKEMDERGDVDWRLVKEIHDQWDYEHSGLGGVAALIIVIIVTYLTAGAASGLVGSMAGATAGSGTAMAAGTAATATTAATAAGWGNVALTSVLTSMASTATVSTINNRGNLGAALDETFSSDNLKSYVSSGITAGLMAGYFDPKLSGNGGDRFAITKGHDIGTFDGILGYARQSGTNALIKAGVDTAVQGGGFKDNFRTSLSSQAQGVLQAVAFNAVGDVGARYDWADGGVEKTALHALVGGLLSEAAGGDFATGAAAAGANEALILHLKELSGENTELLLMASQLVGVAGAAVVGGDAQLGANIAKSGTEFNFLNHQDVRDLEKAQRKCRAEGGCEEVEKEFIARSDANRERLAACAALGNCAEIRREIDAGSFALRELWEAQERRVPDSGAFGYDMEDRNASDWTLAGQLQLEYVGKLFVNGDPKWQTEAADFVDQSGFGIGLNPRILGGASGSAKPSQISSPAENVSQGAAAKARGKDNGSNASVGATADAEAGLPYSHPVRSNSPGDQLAKNKAAGDAFERQVMGQLQQTQSGVVQQVTVRTKSGTKTRIDLMGRDVGGNIVCTECKASATAPLTANQKTAFPEIEESGAVVVGKGKPGFPGGTKIPPTTVNVVRP